MNQAAAIQREHAGGPDRERAVEVGPCLLQVAHAQVGPGAAVQEVAVLAVGSDRLVAVVEGLVQLDVQLHAIPAAIVVDRGQVGVAGMIGDPQVRLRQRLGRHGELVVLRGQRRAAIRLRRQAPVHRREVF